jgi:hypothetical protein
MGSHKSERKGLAMKSTRSRVLAGVFCFFLVIFLSGCSLGSKGSEFVLVYVTVGTPCGVPSLKFTGPGEYLGEVYHWDSSSGGSFIIYVDKGTYNLQICLGWPSAPNPSSCSMSVHSGAITGGSVVEVTGSSGAYNVTFKSIFVPVGGGGFHTYIY